MVFKKATPLVLDKTLTSVSKEIACDFMKMFEDEQNVDFDKNKEHQMFPSPAYGKDLMDDELRLPKISENNYTPSCTEESKMEEQT